MFTPMRGYHHTTINRRAVRTGPDSAKVVAHVVFEAENPETSTHFILDALNALGLPKADSSTLTEFGKIERLDQLPFGLNVNKPNWQNESIKLWLIDPF